MNISNFMILYQLKTKAQPMQKDKLSSKKSPVQFLTISIENEGQRVDNFLVTHLKGVPKSRIYRLVRKGEVRINKKRVAPSYRLMEGDVLRLPPVATAEKAKAVPPSHHTQAILLNNILYEDDNFLIINKPSGMSVHGGSTVRMGVVEVLKHAFPKLTHLELAHRLDAETSGCLILAKRKRILREVHTLLREGQIKKTYVLLTKGHWKRNELRADMPLLKHYRDGGKHMVAVHPEGKTALTIFSPVKTFANASLVEAKLMTGRTHQIRVHAQTKGHPIAGDSRYGDLEFNKYTHALGLRRMFLHALSIDFILPSSGQHITVVAPLPSELEKYLSVLAP